MKDEGVGNGNAGDGPACDTMAEDGATMVVESPELAETRKQPVEQTDHLAAHGVGTSISRLDHLEMPLEVRLGRLEQTLEQVLSLRVGDAVPVGPESDDQVTLYVQGRPYAVGDLVVAEGRFAFRVRELITSE